MMVRLDEVSKKTRELYMEYNYVGVTSLLTNFMTNDLSSYYFDFAKDILMCDAKNDPRRRKVQTVLYHALNDMLKLWSPILPYTTHEAWKVFDNGEATSVHYTHFPKEESYADKDELLAKFDRIHLIREDIFKAREEAIANKIIEKPLEAEVVLHLEDGDRKLLEEAFGGKIDQWLKVSKVSFVEEALTKYTEVEVAIKKAEGVVCPRCWNITLSHREDCLCDRCVKVLNI